MGSLKSPCRDYDLAGFKNIAIQMKPETAAPNRFQPRNVDAVSHWWRDSGRVAFEVLNDFRAPHETIGLGAVVGMSRQLNRPVRRD